MHRYDNIFISDNCLRIKGNFLIEHGETIHSRLKSAYDTMISQRKDCFSNRDIYGINQCIHLATSIVLLGSVAKDLQKTRDSIESSREFLNDDATTIITMAALYYILNTYMKDEEATKTVRGHFKEEFSDWPKLVKHIRGRLDQVNWMVGLESMKKLGIDRVSDEEK